MRDLAGKAAFVTGGASGIGLALGQALAEAGMRVMLADIETNALAEAVAGLRGHDVSSVVCDVADPASVDEAARKAFATFGNVHIVCNNAGVAGGTGIDDIALDTWRWVLDVNLMGVLHGVRAFLPRIRAHGEGGHIVNTASMAGLFNGIGFSPYATSKFAVVAMSEGLAKQLPPEIGVTVICPGFVRTRISESARNRPERYGPARTPRPDSPAGRVADEHARRQRAGMDPARVAALTVDAIRANARYVFPHPDMREELADHFDTILRAMAAAR